MRRLNQGFAALLIFFLELSSARAAALREEFHYLPVGAGVSTPSVLDGLRDNAAIQHAHHRVKVQLMGLTNTTTFNPTTAGAHLMLGTGFLGGQLGFETALPGWTSPSIRAGLGFNIVPIRLAIGTSCSATLANGISVSCNQVGLLFNPRGPIRVGAQITALAYPLPTGFGIAADLGSILTAAVDGSTTFGPNMGLNLVPGLGFRIAFIQFSAGYGFRVLQGTYPLADGFRGAANLIFGRFVAVSFHYNHDGLMHGMLTLRF